ncbi:inner centromere protein isoform X1 [Pygocentrus nattereri]|uniref:inner centromere protein isoform X1 n=1 Tax=Pygocentrus nattereri TaxID=42514 RepID=UPI0008142FE4|nr:inner centromere protein isoform X1 [Pygocentrus nattereri]
MSSLPEAMRSLTQVFTGKLQDFTDEVENVHMLWLEEIQQEAQRMFSSDFSTEPELMPKTPSQKKTSRRKRVSVELNESRSKRRFSKGKRSNLRRSSVQNTLNSISELVVSHAPSSSPDTVAEEPVRRTRRNKAAAADSEPVKRSTRNKAAGKAKEQAEVMEEEAVEVAAVADAPQPPDVPENVLEVKESNSSSSPVQTLLSQAVVKIPSAERLSANKLLESGPSPGRSANKITIAAAGAQASSRTSVRRSLVLRHSLVGLRHSMTQEAVRRASRRSFLKKKARLGNSTCSSSVSGDVSMDVEMEENDVVMENGVKQMLSEEELAEPAAEVRAEAQITQPGDPEPKKPVEDRALMPNEEEKPSTPTAEENCRFTRSMARLSESDSSGKKSQDDVRASRSGSKRRAAESAAIALSTPKKKHSPPKKCMTSITPSMRFLQTVQKNQLLMMTPSSLGRSSIMKSFIKQTGKTDIKLSTGSVERERQKWDALNKKIEQENERKKRLEEERRKKQEEMKKKRDERLKRVVEARVKGEKEKEQEKKKKIEEKMAQIEKKHDLLRVERLAEEKAKKKVATKRQEELELRRKQEEAARKKKLQQAEDEERRHQELLAKRKAEEEREKARKQAEAARALELKKEQERERERERQAAAERERVEREKAIALQKELDRAAKEKERRELEKKREEEQRRAEEERAAQQKHAAAVAPTVNTSVMKIPITKALNATIAPSPALNVTVDIEHSVMKTPVSKGAADMIDKGAGLNVTVDVEQSPQSYQITPKGKKIDVLVNPEDYGMDQNSDDSTDDESAPRKPIPSWAEGMQLQQAIMKRYYDPLDLDSYFGEIEQPRLEKIFQKTKPRFFKRTSSAVWHSPPRMGNMPN